MINKKQIKRLTLKKPLSAFQYYLKEKKDQNPPEVENFYEYWRSMFDKLSNEQKTKYEEISIAMLVGSAPTDQLEPGGY
jgi:CRISPR/Cas system CSM-associated protein Csm2 small subunit